MLKCNSCGGTYLENGKGAPDYFHVCPDQIIDTPETTDPKTHEIVTPATFKKTPNPRNENLRFNPDTEKHEMISEGSGVTVLG